MNFPVRSVYDIRSCIYRRNGKRCVITLVLQRCHISLGRLTPGGSHWQMVYGDAQRFWGAFSYFFSVSMGGLSSHTQCANLQNWVYFGKFSWKSTQFGANWVLFAAKWYRDGSQNHAFWGIEMVEILKLYFEHPRTNFFEEPPGCLNV